MGELNRPGGAIAPAIIAGGASTVQPETNLGTKLAASTTYLFTFENAGALIAAFGIKWDAAIIFTATVEDTTMPAEIVSNYDITAGNGWVPEVPATFPVTNGSVTTGVLTVAGGTAGSGIAHLPNLGSGRLRLKVVVAGTGGYLVVCPRGKA